MPTTRAHLTRQHSNLRPKHKQTKNYLQTYWPYMPLLIIVAFGMYLVRPWSQGAQHRSGVLSYATSVSSQELLAATNSERVANNEADLQLSGSLSKAAQSKAEDMVKRNYWSHKTPEGTAPWSFVTKAGYQYQKAAENLAYGFASSSETVSGWMNSPEHRTNILDKAYTDVGFGFANSKDFNNSGPVTVIVAYYGRPASATPYTNTSVPQTSHQSGQPTTAKLSQDTQTVSRFDSLTGGLLPGATYAFVFLMGAAVAILVIKHGYALKKTIRKGEKYAVQHPLFDITLVALIVVAIIAIGKVGVIL